jgi:hypothetical protein
LYENLGDGTEWREQVHFDAELATGSGPTPLGDIADLDCDGDPDLTVSGGLYFQQDDGEWSEVEMLHDAYFGGPTQLGDLDGDGDFDAVLHRQGHGFYVYLNDGTGHGWTEIDHQLPAHADENPIADYSGDTFNDDGFGFALGDVDGDGRLDLVRPLRVYTTDFTTSQTVGHFVEVWTRPGPG